MTRGLFVAFEGGEGSGKTTQAETLRDRMTAASHRAVLVREPGATVLGLYLREYLKSKRPLCLEAELMLFEAARAQLMNDHIRPALEQGVNVITDRFTGSTLAYQGYGKGIRLTTIREMNAYATGGTEPDLTMFLDLDPERAADRIRAPQAGLFDAQEAKIDGRQDPGDQRRFEDLKPAFHRKVRRGYREQAKTEPGWITLDAALPAHRLSDLVWEAVKGALPGPTRPD